MAEDHGGEPPAGIAGVSEGEILAGKYRVERVLGVGGMGVVVAARHVELDSRVALKFLLPALRANAEAVGRFVREARNAVKIQNEYVARVFDVGSLANGTPYMVMEFLEGEDLATWLARRGPLAIEQAVDFVLQACVAVVDAHGLGIVHRDLKPANLFCIRRNDGQFIVKVLDFGISKQTDAARTVASPGMSVTKTNAIMGSPFYMSPEQVQSAKDVDARTDIWALGVILFELLTGVVPFPGEAFGEIAIRIARDPYTPIRAYRPAVPPALEEAIGKCLEKDRQLRYPNVADLAQALLPFGTKRARALVERISGILTTAGLSASALALPASPPVRQETVAEPGSVAPWAGTMTGRRSKTFLLGGLLAAGATGALLIALALRTLPTPPKGTGSTLDSDSAPRPPEIVAASGTLGIEAATPECAVGETQCRENRPITCKEERWVLGEVTSGQCGATCTPGVSAPRCNRFTPQTCTPAGQWQDGAPCSRSSACGNGECIPWTPPHPDPGQPSVPHPDCQPNYTIDRKTGAHIFKPECFSK